jgi:hypothetical protein
MKNAYRWFLFVLVGLTGCAAHMMETRGDSIQLLNMSK